MSNMAQIKYNCPLSLCNNARPALITVKVNFHLFVICFSFNSLPHIIPTFSLCLTCICFQNIKLSQKGNSAVLIRNYLLNSLTLTG